MSYWIEPISKEKSEANRRIPALPFTWYDADVPQIPVSLPISALLRVNDEGIFVEAKRENGSGPYPAEETNFQFLKQDIVSVDIWLMPPIEDGMNYDCITSHDYSRAVIHHRDPFEVVESFASTFTADQHYWLRALAKYLKQLGISHTLEEITSRD